VPTLKKQAFFLFLQVQGGSNMTGTNCDLFTHKEFRSYLNHLVFRFISHLWVCCMCFDSLETFQSPGLFSAEQKIKQFNVMLVLNTSLHKFVVYFRYFYLIIKKKSAFYVLFCVLTSLADCFLVIPSFGWTDTRLSLLDKLRHLVYQWIRFYVSAALNTAVSHILHSALKLWNAKVIFIYFAYRQQQPTCKFKQYLEKIETFILSPAGCKRFWQIWTGVPDCHVGKVIERMKSYPQVHVWFNRQLIQGSVN
jgi:hypothetical protein